ncbi:MAG TPA: PAS domain S-box protein, partial [Verrucomicrobiae bacterium]
MAEIETLRTNLNLERQQMEAEEITLAQAQQELELSRERYVNLYESAPIGYITLDRLGVVCNANAAAENMLGRERGKLIGLSLAGLILTEDRPALREHFWRVRREEKPVAVELRFTAFNGPVSVIQLTSIQGEDVVDGRMQFRVALTDVTARRHAEEAMRQSEQRFRTMADGAPVLIWVAGLDKGYTWFNQPWLNFTGRMLEESLGTGWVKNVRPEDLERVLQIYKQAFDARQEFQMEYRLRRHDGEWRWMMDHGVPIGASPEKFAGYIGSCVDITDRKQVEADLREKESELRFVADHTPVCLARCTRDLRYKFVNRACAELLGLPPEEIVGRPLREIMGEAAFQTIRPFVEEVLNGQPVEYETEISLLSSGPHFVHVNY